MSAYVYLIQEKPFPGENSGPWTKIGYSKNPPEWRMNANLKRGNPREIEIAAAFTYESEREARDAERKAHEHFAEYQNDHGKEWFRLPAAEIRTWLESEGAKLLDKPQV